MSPRARLSGEEAGETLIEVILAAALMGAMVVALVGGMATVLFGSVVHRDQASANSVLVSAMERLKSADVARVQCAGVGESTYVAAVQAAKPASWPVSSTPTIDSIRYQKFDSTATNPFSIDDTTCNDNGTNGLALQQVTISVTAPDGRATRTLSFVKGDN
jgi:type II secretory pathway pseudopilin PulG